MGMCGDAGLEVWWEGPTAEQRGFYSYCTGFHHVAFVLFDYLK